MCGIVGFVDKSKNKKKIIKDMADLIKHRGPDSDGYYVDDDVAQTLGGFQAHMALSYCDVVFTHHWKSSSFLIDGRML